MRRVLIPLLLICSFALAQQPRSPVLPSTAPSTRPASTRPASVAEAHRIVFLVDTTRMVGPMVSKVKEELNLVVDHLRDDQMFTILVSRPQNLVPKPFSQNPIRATRAIKDEAKDFIRVIDDERATNLPAAIRKAVEWQPDLLVYIPCDTSPQTEAVRQAFRALHGRLNIVLFTGFIPHPEEFLRTLALEHGGVAMDQRGNVLEPPKPKVEAVQKPESRPSVFER